MDIAAVRRVVLVDRKVERAAGILKALGHPVRLRLVADLCCRGERAVGDLCRDLDLPQAAVSQQLGILRLHGLVVVRRSQGFRYYSVAERQTEQLLHCITSCPLVADA